MTGALEDIGGDLNTLSMLQYFAQHYTTGVLLFTRYALLAPTFRLHRAMYILASFWRGRGSLHQHHLMGEFKSIL
jgi:hypothetical protein